MSDRNVGAAAGTGLPTTRSAIWNTPASGRPTIWNVPISANARSANARTRPGGRAAIPTTPPLIMDSGEVMTTEFDWRKIDKIFSQHRLIPSSWVDYKCTGCKWKYRDVSSTETEDEMNASFDAHLKRLFEQKGRKEQ